MKGVTSKVAFMNSAPQLLPASSVEPANTRIMPSAMIRPRSRTLIPARRNPEGATSAGTAAPEAAEGPAAGEAPQGPPGVVAVHDGATVAALHAHVVGVHGDVGDRVGGHRQREGGRQPDP